MLPGDTINTIHDLIAAQAQSNPQAEAILDIERNPLTYFQLYKHLNTTQKAFNSMGLGRGDRIAIVLPNGPEMATAFLTAAACCVSAPLNPNYRGAEFDYYLSDLQVSALLTLQGLESQAIESARKPSYHKSQLVAPNAGNLPGCAALHNSICYSRTR